LNQQEIIPYSVKRKSLELDNTVTGFSNNKVDFFEVEPKPRFVFYSLPNMLFRVAFEMNMD
jgi:hypothetical protein